MRISSVSARRAALADHEGDHQQEERDQGADPVGISILAAADARCRGCRAEMEDRAGARAPNPERGVPQQTRAGAGRGGCHQRATASQAKPPSPRGGGRGERPQGGDRELAQRYESGERRRKRRLTAPAARDADADPGLLAGPSTEEADGEEQGERQGGEAGGGRVQTDAAVRVRRSRIGAGTSARPKIGSVIPPAFPSEDEDPLRAPRPLAGAHLCSEVSGDKYKPLPRGAAGLAGLPGLPRTALGEGSLGGPGG